MSDVAELAAQLVAIESINPDVVPGGHTVLWDAFDETAAAIGAFLST